MTDGWIMGHIIVQHHVLHIRGDISIITMKNIVRLGRFYLSNILGGAVL